MNVFKQRKATMHILEHIIPLMLQEKHIVLLHSHATSCGTYVTVYMVDIRHAGSGIQRQQTDYSM